MASNVDQSSLTRSMTAGLLAWVLPGLGHIYIGDRNRGLICLVTIALTFWAGVALGGARGTVDPHTRKLWFVAQLGSGGHALAAYGLNRGLTASSGDRPAPTHWLRSDVGTHYTGVAGLLNLLVILDAISRAEWRGSQTGRRSRGQRSVA